MENENVISEKKSTEAEKLPAPKRKMSGSKKRKIRRALFIVAMLAWPIFQFLVTWVYVNIDTVVMTFQKYKPGGSVLAEPWYFNYADMFSKFNQPYQYSPLKIGLKNSLLYFPFNNFLLLPLSLICAYLLYKKVAGARIFRVIFFFPSIISAVVLTLIFKFMFSTDYGPINDILRALGLGGLIPQKGWFADPSTAQGMIFLYCLWAGIGYNVVLFTGAMQRVPVEVLESARIDGVGMTRELVQIMIPMIFPTITTLFVQGCTVVFTIFMQPMLLTQGAAETMTIAYYIVNQVKTGSQIQMIGAATVGVFFSVIAIPIIFLVKTLLEKITPQVEY